MTKWTLYNNNNRYLKPIQWKYGNQLKSVQEILNSFQNSTNKQKISFYHSVCGSGKSATLLHVIKNTGKGIIVVPTLNLQKQYYEDYGTGNNKYILKENKKLKVGTMYGRSNFTCKYLKDKIDKGETLIDDIIIYDKQRISCATKGLPCNRILKKGENRVKIASKCPYYIPPPRKKEDIKKWKYKQDEATETNKLEIYMQLLKCNDIKYYMGVDNSEYGIFIKEDMDTVCDYYKQFYNYLSDTVDVIIFNRWKWEIETEFGRKPIVDIECFDEADYFLNLLNKSIEISDYNIKALCKSVYNEKNTSNKLSTKNKKKNSKQKIEHQKLEIMKNELLSQFNLVYEKISNNNNEKNNNEKNNNEKNNNGSYESNRNNNDYGLSKKIVKFVNEIINITNDIDDSIYDILYKIRLIHKYSEKYTLTAEEKIYSKSIKYNIPYPDLILNDLLKKSSNKILMTSATIHNQDVLEMLFNLKFDNIISGRIDQPGRLIIMKPKTGMIHVSHINWEKNGFKEYYDDLLKYIVLKLNEKGNTLILTPAKKYVNSIIKYLKEKKTSVNVDFSGEEYYYKSNGNENDIIISYRMMRGVDLSDNNCRVIIWTKYPLVNLSDGYTKALFNRFGKNAWKIVNDAAVRDTVQGVCRGLRSDKDWVIFSTPDSRVFDVVTLWWNEQLKIKESVR